MKKASRRELASVIARELIAGKPSAHLMQQLAAYLVEHKMTGQIDMLIDDITVELQTRTGHTAAHVTTANDLSADTRRQVEAFVRSITSAKTVELETTTDTSLIGGVIINTPGYQYDASVRHKLNQLAQGEM